MVREKGAKARIRVAEPNVQDASFSRAGAVVGSPTLPAAQDGLHFFEGRLPEVDRPHIGQESLSVMAENVYMNADGSNR